MRSVTAISLLLASLATAREIPQNLQTFYESNKNGICSQPVSIPYRSAQSEADTVYCKDNPTGALFLKDDTTGYADMDIDCDGLDRSSGDCFNDPTGQSQTAFKDLVKEYGGIEDLSSQIHSYIVLGNDNSETEGNGGQKFDPEQDAGIKPLSVVAVVCNNKLFYGVWGDVNGGYLTGESSLALAKRCYPDEGLNGNKGHGDHDVLYIAFPGEEAVIGKDAAWGASTPEEFEESLAAVGDKLVAKLGGGIIGEDDGSHSGNGTGNGNGTWGHFRSKDVIIS
ncbi:glycoside hydrolase family 75 protein [Amniculicola lignicola CBS 123094]|uniref:Endo-chitosanase n=1 Tax=Amniculicola lignicola CBS 123094 TaxID=1392246 RepID=A0A6A5WIK3_9PLEO|nr:glycoside hydrolase family 75 protein [Amniculicola lignicola CBS 123094]